MRLSENDARGISAALTQSQLSEFSNLKLPVIGGKDCEGVTKTPKHGETFKIGQEISVKALHTPCHTQDSICWLMEDGEERVVFTGDTLFIGGRLIIRRTVQMLSLTALSRLRPFLRRNACGDAYSSEQDSGGITR